MTEDPLQDPCRGRPKTPGRILAGDARETPERPLLGASAGPRLGPPPLTLCCPAATLTRLSAHQLGERLHGSMQLLGQLVKHLRGGMQIFVKTKDLQI